MAERMLRCAEGHFYDAGKHSACPWCAPPLDITPAEGQKTRPMADVTPPMATPTAPMAPAAPAAAPAPAKEVIPPMAGPILVKPDAETQRFGTLSKGIDPVVGWLVCLDGPERGRDYRLKMERNFIGRSPFMDVSLGGDERVSRERHASLVFDPKNRSFWLVPGEATGLVYLNGTLVHTPIQLKGDDVIELGKSKLVLIPFCGDKYEWQS